MHFLNVRVVIKAEMDVDFYSFSVQQVFFNR